MESFTAWPCDHTRKVIKARADAVSKVSTWV